MSLAEELVTRMLKCIGDAEEIYDSNYDNVKVKEAETQDLLHEIELSNFNASQGCILAKELQKVRRERRKMKDENELLFYLYDMVKKNPGFKNTLINVHKNIKKKERDINERYYKAKVREDLTICG